LLTALSFVFIFYFYFNSQLNDTNRPFKILRKTPKKIKKLPPLSHIRKL
jgi:hypothetical protein